MIVCAIKSFAINDDHPTVTTVYNRSRCCGKKLVVLLHGKLYIGAFMITLRVREMRCVKIYGSS